MIIRGYFLAFLIFIIINVELMHFSSIKCFIIICVLWNIIPAKWICSFIDRFSIFIEILHCGKHHLLLVAFKRVILFISLYFKVKLGSLNVINLILFLDASLMIILNVKRLGVLIVTWGISKHVIIRELFLFLIKCYLFL